NGSGWVELEGFWLRRAPPPPLPHTPSEAAAAASRAAREAAVLQRYVLTPSIRARLRDIARVLAGRERPAVLLEGPTAAGKTAAVEYAAALTGTRLVRINNHEHTDLAEYVGQYAPQPDGSLAWRPGPLVAALRAGWWVVLDELNLAPPELLEALNRLLDGNRELRLAETGEAIRAHPDFVLFATQNPAGGAYGGRKRLSRAFRSRFVALRAAPAPPDELTQLLHTRSAGRTPLPFCARMVDVLGELRRLRDGARVFAGADGLVTVRDLFRWAGREPGTYDELAAHGHALLAGRLREPAAAAAVVRALTRAIPSASVEACAGARAPEEGRAAEGAPADGPPGLHVVWTAPLGALLRRVRECVGHNEPTLLVGETGCGKTTAVQLAAHEAGATLTIVNCHAHTEAADLLGALRPVRNRNRLRRRLLGALDQVLAAAAALEDATAVAAAEAAAAAAATAAAGGPLVTEPAPKRARGSDGAIKSGSADGADDGAEEGADAEEAMVADSGPSDDEPEPDADLDHAETGGDAEGAGEVQAEADEAAEIHAVDARRAAVRKALRRAAATIAPLATADGAAGGGGSTGGRRRRSGAAANADGLPDAEAVCSARARRALRALMRAQAAARFAEGAASALFCWQDGPLITAMRQGGWVLLDEVSLADDAVLERLNSLLDPSGTICLAEKPADGPARPAPAGAKAGGKKGKGGTDGAGEVEGGGEEVTAHANFRIFATMNPGGDYGKRELSPALRNRFVEIWVPSPSAAEHILPIVAHALRGDGPDGTPLARAAPVLVEALQWARAAPELRATPLGAPSSLRGVLAWAAFVGAAAGPLGSLTRALMHGGCLVLADAVGAEAGADAAARDALRARVLGRLWALAASLDGVQFSPGPSPALLPPAQAGAGWGLALQAGCPPPLGWQLAELDGRGRMLLGSPGAPFTLDVAPFDLTAAAAAEAPRAVVLSAAEAEDAPPAEADLAAGGGRGGGYALDAPTTGRNAFRIVRAMLLARALLLEGSPGVGKTSLVAALAATAGVRLLRVNLSEQSELADLLGQELPAADCDGSEEGVDGAAVAEESGNGNGGMRFVWRDGVLLAALQAGHWLLLDELNLAPQPVLEGLNAVLDHRAEAYVPELGRAFRAHPRFRIFACQNPLAQGGGRKGLPKSLVNRFARVWLDELLPADLLHIARAGWAGVLADDELLARMVATGSALAELTAPGGGHGGGVRLSGLGAPWDFNLRDLSRWLGLLASTQRGPHWRPEALVSVVFAARMRSAADRDLVCEIAAQCLARLSHSPRPSGSEGALEAARADCEWRPRPRLLVTPRALLVGDAALPRAPPAGADADDADGPPPRAHALPPAHVGALRALVHAAANGWPALLTGPPGCGKRSLVHALAQLSGREHALTELALGPTTDTAELLGGFEQRPPRAAPRGLWLRARHTAAIAAERA
ncbi:P-loop containing nucleoside triphosphate hydrolase protein, partial [Pavlovales sp. CCMP2436]